MKRIIAILLALTLVLSFAACQEGTGDITHTTPADKLDHAKYTLERTDFDQHIESILNIQAYPDILMYDATSGELLGMYIYDPETGLATGWTDLTTGERHTFEAGKEVNLGKPDPAKTVQLDTIKLNIVVYEKEGKATGAELYFYLSDGRDAVTLVSFMSNYFGEPLVMESETVYKLIKDQDAVLKDFAAEERAGSSFFSKNAAEYINVLKLNYGVTLIEE
jgi:hypothetical protein